MRTLGAGEWALEVRSRSVLVLLVAFSLVGCGGPQRPTTTYEPTIIGVVQESNAGYDETITLDDGQTIDVASGRSLTEGRPSGGELFLGGIDEDGLWFQDARPGTSDCSFILRSNAWDGGGSVILESGLRVQKADDFVGEPSVREPPPILCLNEDGQATSAR